MKKTILIVVKISWLLMLSFVISLFISTPAVAAISQAERDALISLYNSTDGANWEDSSGWLGASGTECSWHGISCDEENTTVILLDLERNQLTGSIPPELGNLTNLGRLYLEHNQLTGSIPPELGNLANLENFSLYDNQLTGSIPPELGNLSILTRLNFNHNQLTGSIPPELGNLPYLQSLALGPNQLTGPIPPELCNLTNLGILNLEGNQLTGSIPPELGNLTSLYFLGLNSNQLTGSIPPELGNLTSLIYLGLNSNQLTGSIPPELGNLGVLQALVMYGNQLTGMIPIELMNMTSLTSLNICDNNLEATDPDLRDFLSNLQPEWEDCQATRVWQLISLSQQPGDTSIEAVLVSIIDKVISVWAYVDGGWRVYDPENPGFSDLTAMEAGRGYWLHLSESASLTISGSAPSNSIEISNGWNLVGYNSSTSQAVADALASIEGQYISVWAYMDGGWKVYDPENPGFSDLLTMEPGYGYWINASEACTWILP